MQILTTLKMLGCEVEPCGSRVTCEPAPTDTDQDFLVLVPSAPEMVASVVNKLDAAEFKWEGEEHYQQVAATDFMSWRRDDVNFIVTSNKVFAKKHRAATSVCKRLNLLAKADRVAVFQAVLYAKAEVTA